MTTEHQKRPGLLKSLGQTLEAMGKTPLDHTLEQVEETSARLIQLEEAVRRLEALIHEAKSA